MSPMLSFFLGVLAGLLFAVILGAMTLNKTDL